MSAAIVWESASTLVRSGLLRPEDPRTFVAAAKAQRKWDRSPAGGIAANAIRYGDEICLVDEAGEMSFNELHERTNRLANALAGAGIGAGDQIGILCRDHRYFVYGLIAASKLGADALLLNTSFSAPQLADVMSREGAAALVYDAEFGALADACPDSIKKFVAWEGDGEGSVDHALRTADSAEPQPPAQPGRQILLTSGTTGTPKGAKRPRQTPMASILGYLSRVPLRTRDRLFVASPMFHAWGFANLGLGLLLAARIDARRRFDPEQTLAVIESEKIEVLPIVPVMAQRIMELPREVHAKYDCSSLRVSIFGGSAIPGDLAVRFMDEFGDIVHNVYGSTEVAVVSVASPADLRANPQTAGKPLRAVAVKLLDDEENEVPVGEVGRIFAGGAAAFEGYTDGGNKAIAHGLLSSGDVGKFDSAGRLSIEGRDDDMIVSGGENVFPHEVEDVISAMDDVVEVAVIGVSDDDFGQRLRAFVVRTSDDLSEDDVRAHVRAQLARFKVPRDVRFVDELPRTATGKILKRELATN
jgi:fatty-acyl-CoA synthase